MSRGKALRARVGVSYGNKRTLQSVAEITNTHEDAYCSGALYGKYGTLLSFIPRQNAFVNASNNVGLTSGEMFRDGFGVGVNVQLVINMPHMLPYGVDAQFE